MAGGWALKVGYHDTNGVGEDGFRVGTAEEQQVLEAVAPGDAVNIKNFEAFGLWHKMVKEEAAIVGGRDRDLELIECTGDRRNVLGRIAEVGDGRLQWRGGGGRSRSQTAYWESGQT